MQSRASHNVKRAASVLLSLGDAGSQGLSLGSLAAQIGDEKSIVHRTVAGLVETGFVEQVRARGAYRLGPAIYALSNRSETRDIVEACRPVLIELSAQTGAPAFLMARAGLDALCIAHEEGMLSVQTSISGVGGRLPLGVGAASICILAQIDPRSCAKILELNEQRYSKEISKDTLKKSVEITKARQFFAIDFKVVIPLKNIAVMVPCPFGNIPLAISIVSTEKDSKSTEDIADYMKNLVLNKIDHG